MVHFVGAGSGAVDLITVRGAKLLGEADVVIYAGSLVNPELLNYCKEGCAIHNSAKMTLEQVLTYKELLRFRQPKKYYAEEEIEEAKDHPVITHTTNFFYVKKRIFEENSDHPMRPQYEKYRALTPWKDDPAMTVTPTFKQKLQKNIWHLMPKSMAISIGCFVRNEVRPRLEKKRDDE